MPVVAFDAFSAASALKDAGVEPGQAEAIAGAVLTAAGGRDDLATKADLAELRADLTELRADTKAGFAELRADTKAGMAELATKAEIAAFQSRAKAEIAALREDTKADLRAELVTIRWAVGLTVVFMLAIASRVFGLI